MLDFAERTETRAIQLRRADVLIKRDREHGGLIPRDRETEEIARSLRGWLAPYRADVTSAEVRRARAGIELSDYRLVTIQRLSADVRRGVKRWSKADRPEIEARALALLLQWPEHGSDPSERYPEAIRTDLGGRAARERAILSAATEPNRARRVLKMIDALEHVAWTLPERRVWLDAERRQTDNDGKRSEPMLTRGALRAIRAAVKQAAADLRAELERAPMAMDTTDFSEAAENQRRGTERAVLPEVLDAPEQLASIMGVSLDAARAIIARGYPHSLDALAETWSLSHGALKVALSRGAKQLRSRYPDPNDLLDAIDEAARYWRDETEQSATLALSTYAAYPDDPERWIATQAVAEWRGAHRPMEDHERAHLAAARAAERRHGASYGGERAERIAQSAERIMDAEEARKRRNGRVRQTGALARTYPGSTWYVATGQRAATVEAWTERHPMDEGERRNLESKRAELLAMLERGESNADLMRTLRGTSADTDWIPVDASYGIPSIPLPERARRAEEDWTTADFYASHRMARLVGAKLEHPSARQLLAWISAAEQVAALPRAERHMRVRTDARWHSR